MIADRVEQAYFAPFLDDSLGLGLEDFDPKDFRPNIGTILVVVPPPPKKTKGGVELPQTAQVRPCVARIAAVPEGEEFYQPGDWIVFQRDSGLELPLQDRKDLRLLQYTQGPDSDILGKFQRAL